MRNYLYDFDNPDIEDEKDDELKKSLQNGFEYKPSFASKYSGTLNAGLDILGNFMYNTNNYALNFNYQPILPGIGNRDAIINNNIDIRYQPLDGVSTEEYITDAAKNGITIGMETGNIWAGIGATGASILGNYFKDNKIKEENRIGFENALNSNRRQNEINNYALGQTDLYNTLIQRRHMAEGGLLHTHGATFDNGLTYFNEGGTHELNPYGGILQGINPEDGEPNLVEEGETKWNDYIFSNRYKLGGSLLKKYLLPKEYEGLTFAEASKKIGEPVEDVPGSVIEKRTMDTMMSRLMAALEDKKQKEVDRQAMREYKKGGHMFLWGGEDDYPLIYGDPITVKLPSNYIDWQTIEQNNPQTYINENDIVDSNLDWIDYDYIKPNTINNKSNIPSDSKYLVKKNNNIDIRSKFNPHYLTLLDNFVSVLGDKLGLTNQPDYSRSRMIRDAASNIRNADYLNPYLRDYIPEQLPIAALINTYRSQYAGNDARTIAATNGNVAAAQAARIANENERQAAIGDLALNAIQYNNQEAARASELNNKSRLEAAQLHQANSLFNATQGNRMYEALKDYINDLSILDALASSALEQNANNLREGLQNYLMESEDKQVIAQLIKSGALRFDPNTGAYYLNQYLV